MILSSSKNWFSIIFDKQRWKYNRLKGAEYLVGVYAPFLHTVQFLHCHATWNFFSWTRSAVIRWSYKKRKNKTTVKWRIPHSMIFYTEMSWATEMSEDIVKTEMGMVIPGWWSLRWLSWFMEDWILGMLAPLDFMRMSGMSVMWSDHEDVMSEFMHQQSWKAERGRLAGVKE